MPDHVHVLLDRRARDGLGSLLQAGEDHLHPGLAQRVGHDGDADRVGVHAELRQKHP